MRILFLITFLSFFRFTYCQVTDKLYFLGCSPDRGDVMLDSLNTNLYSIKNDSLIISRKIAYFKDQTCTNIKYLNNNCLLLFIKRMQYPDSTNLIIIPFSDIENQRSFYLGVINIYRARWFCKENYNIEILIDCYDYSIAQEILLSIAINNGYKKIVTTGALKNTFYSEGARTIFSDWTTLYITKGFDAFYIYPINYGDSAVKIEPVLQEKLSSSKLVIVVNTDKYLIYSIDDSIYNKKTKLGQLKLIIHNKLTNNWSDLVLQGDLTNHALYGNWLSGEVINFFSNKDFIESPGKKYRKQEIRPTGSPIDIYFEKKKMYCPGILYLYNIETQKYIEWDAIENDEHQGDSEIILVQDEIVYYRVNDKIYKAPIINGEKLGEPVLLITDPRVPDIHWAFITGD